MNISTKGRYAVRAMIDLALQSREGTENPTVIKDISERQCISDLYLGQIFARLKAAGLVRSLRGPNGGFKLSMPPSKISVRDILLPMEGSIAAVDCVDDATLCPRSDGCVARELWTKMKKKLDELLGSTTLEDLMNWSLEDLLKRNRQDPAD
jgi:Rrf2 family cysteine metabolism transcriptional repressor